MASNALSGGVRTATSAAMLAMRSRAGIGSSALAARRARRRFARSASRATVSASAGRSEQIEFDGGATLGAEAVVDIGVEIILADRPLARRHLHAPEFRRTSSLHVAPHLLAGAAQARHDRPERNAERRCCFDVGKVLHRDQQENRALLLRQGFQRIQDVSTHACGVMSSGKRRGGLERGVADVQPPPRAAPQRVEMQVAQEREEPCAHIAVRPPLAPARQGALERVLDEIVRFVTVPQQGRRVAAQPGNVLLEKVGGPVHTHLRSQWRRGSGRRGATSGAGGVVAF